MLITSIFHSSITNLIKTFKKAFNIEYKDKGTENLLLRRLNQESEMWYMIIIMHYILVSFNKTGR